MIVKSAYLISAYLIIALSFLIITGCTSKNYKENPKIISCNNHEIERVMQKLYDKSVTKIEKITRFINYKSFVKTCSGEFEARTPLGGIFTEHKYPEISFGFDVEYDINNKNGICITKLSKPRSAGVYKNCFK